MNIVIYKLKIGSRWSTEYHDITTPRSAAKIQERVQALTGCKVKIVSVGTVI